MKRRGLIGVLTAALLSVMIIFPSSRAGLRLPGDQIFSLVSIVFGLKARRDAYRMADRLLNNQLDQLKTEQQKLKVMSDKGWITQRKYGLSGIYIADQRKRYEKLHQLLKSEAHHEFDKMFQQEVLANAFNRLGQSKTFVREADRLGNVLTESLSHMDSSINALQRVKKAFWPDQLREAHDKIKEARKMLDTMQAIGVNTGDVGRTLLQLDQKLDKLKKNTDPKTINAMLGDMEEGRKITEELRNEVTGAAEKLKSMKAEAIRVTRWVSKDPEIQRLMSEIPAYQDLIHEPEIRWAMGEDMHNRSKDLGLDPYSKDFEKIRKEYLAQLVAHLKQNPKQRIGPDLMDSLLIAAVKKAAGKDVAFAAVKAVITGKVTSGTAPLDVHLESTGSFPEHPDADFEWRIVRAEVKDGSTFSDPGPSGGPIYSYTFKKPGEYTVELVVTDRRGQQGRATQTITVASKYTTEVTVQVSVNPKKAKPGEKITISATPTGSKDIENASVTLVVKVDGKEFAREEIGEMGYGDASSVTYPIPEDAEAREYPVTVQAIASLPDELKKVMKKETVASEEVPDSFYVEGGKLQEKDPFVGVWSISLRLIDAANKEKLENLSDEEIGLDYVFMEIGMDADGYWITDNMMQHVDSIKRVNETLVVEGRNVSDLRYWDEGLERFMTRTKTDKVKIEFRVSEDAGSIRGIIQNQLDVGYRENDYETIRMTGERQKQ